MTYQKILLKEYIEMLGAASAVPGGGSVSALAGAMSASLGKMVVGLTRNPKLKRYETRFRKNCVRLLKLSEQDSTAYGQVMEAYRLPKSNPAETTRRAKQVQKALYKATLVPLAGMTACLDNLQTFAEIAARVKPSVKSDFGVGVLLSRAGLKGCLMNVNINLSYLKDQRITDKISRQSRLLNQKIEQITRKLKAYL